MPMISKRTTVLMIVLVLTVAASVTALKGANQSAVSQGGGNTPPKGASEKFRSKFPVVDYDVPEDPDPDKQKERREKGRRYDRFPFVNRTPSSEVTETAFLGDWYENGEALPVKQSHSIVVGVVMSSEAHISNNRHCVYTEFEVEVREVLKNNGGNLTGRHRVHADRPGGYVRYPGGQKQLYRFADMNMPAVGGEYLFFLVNPDRSPNYEVLTAYELSPQGVTPLDSLALFRAYTGMERSAFLSKVRELIQTSN
jgi:hypothetical protein